MNPIIVAVLTSLLVGGAACSGTRVPRGAHETTAAARHAARGDSPWLEDALSRNTAGDETVAAGSGDESESSEGSDDLGDEGSDDFGDQGSDEAGSEDGEEMTIDFGDEGLDGDEDWEDEEDQG
jgi:hypothetical protein